MINRKAVLSLAGALLALSSVSEARTRSVDTVYRPLPYPCDDAIGGCNPKPRPKPWECYRLPCGDRPFNALSGMQGKVEAITGAVAGGDIDAASNGLGALFNGSASGDSAPVAVAADIKEDPNPPTIFYPDGKPEQTDKPRKASLRSIDGPVAMGEFKDGVMPVGAAGAVGGAVVGEIVNRAVREAEKAAERYVERDQTKESIEKYGGCRMKGTCSK